MSHDPFNAVLGGSRGGGVRSRQDDFLGATAAQLGQLPELIGETQWHRFQFILDSAGLLTQQVQYMSAQFAPTPATVARAQQQLKRMEENTDGMDYLALLIMREQITKLLHEHETALQAAKLILFSFFDAANKETTAWIDESPDGFSAPWRNGVHVCVPPLELYPFAVTYIQSVSDMFTDVTVAADTGLSLETIKLIQQRTDPDDVISARAAAASADANPLLDRPDDET